MTHTESAVVIKNRQTRRLAVIAWGVGAATIVLSFVVSYFAYRSSRAAVLDVVANQNLATSQSIVNEAIALLENSADTGSDAPLDAVEQVWQRTVPPVKGSYLCVIRPPGEFALHTLKPKMVGTDVSKVVCERRSGRESVTVKELLTNKSNHAGININFRGIWQLAGYAYYEPLDSLVVTHIPVQKLDAQISAAALPWGISLGVLTGGLFPLALLLLHAGYRRANQQTVLAIDAIASGERQLQRQFTELALVYDTTPVGLCFLDTDLRFVRINSEVARINRLPVREHIGRSIREVLPDLANIIEPIYQGVIKSGEPLHNVEFDKNDPSNNDGTDHYIASYYPVIDHEHSVIGVSAVVQNVTERKRAETVEFDRREQLQRMLDTLPELIWMSDTSGGMAWFNQSWLSFTGRALDQELGNGWTTYVHPDDVERGLEHYAQAFERREPIAMEYRHRHHSGEYRWLYDSGHPMLSRDGEFEGYIGSCVDIHDRKMVEEQLRIKDLAIRSSVTGICFTDLKGLLTDCNPAFLRMWKAESVEQLRGRSVTELGTDPELVQRILAAIRDTGSWEGVDVAKRLDGTSMHIRVTAALIHGDHEPVGLMATFRDITEQAIVEGELLKTQEDLERAQAIAKLGSWSYDPVGGKGKWSRELFVLFDRDPELGAPAIAEFIENVHPEDRDLFSVLEHGSQSGPRVTIEFRSNPEHGPLRHFISNMEWKMDDGRILLNGTTQEVTDQVAAQAQRTESQRREVLLKEIHHRVKNNLQIISSLLFLQSSHQTDDDAAGFLTECQTRVKSIALIHEKLYRSSTLSSLDFAEYVRDLTSDLLQTYSVDQQTVTIHTSMDDVFLDLDTAIPCGLIINELISNAFKHAFPSSSRGSIEIRMEATAGDEHCLVVCDDGVGFPEGFDWKTSNSFGLRLVMDLAHQMEASTELSTDRGTQFTIRFKDASHRSSEALS